MGRLNSALSALANRGVFDMSENKPAVEVVPLEATEATPTIPTVIDSPDEARSVPADALAQVQAVESDVAHAPESTVASLEREAPDRSEEPHAFEMPAAQAPRVEMPRVEASSVETPTIELPLRSSADPETPEQESMDSEAAVPGVYVTPGDDEPEDPAAEADAALREVEQFGARFSSNTTDMNELRAQLGIVSKAEVTSRSTGEQMAEPECTEPEQPEAVADTPHEEATEASPSETYDESCDETVTTDEPPEQIDSQSDASDARTVEFPGEINELQSQQADDESQQVIKLVEQVLGISPGIRTDQSETNVIDAVTAASSESVDSFTPSEESSIAPPDEESPEDISPQEQPNESESAEVEPNAASVSEGETTPEDDSYNPVMQNWATIPAAGNPVDDGTANESHENVAVEQTHEQEAASAECGENEEIETQQQAALPICDAPEVTSEVSSEPAIAAEVAPQTDSSPVENDLATSSESADVKPVETELPERKDPSEYEVALAERLLKSDFGLQIQELNNNVISEFSPDQPAAMVMVSIDGDPQRSDVVAGLGMVVCAQRTSPTLIVDGDVDQRAISQGFEQSGSGVLESLTERTPWQQSIDATSCERLRVLGSGSERQAIQDSASLVARAKTAVDQWKQEFGLVLIDGGPISSPLAIALAAASDATFVCVELGQSERDNLVDATERLVAAGAIVKGCITTGTAAPS